MYEADYLERIEELKAENERLRAALNRSMMAIDEVEYLAEQCSTLLRENERLRAALAALWHDCLATDFNEHWHSFKEAEKTLTQTQGNRPLNVLSNSSH